MEYSAVQRSIGHYGLVQLAVWYMAVPCSTAQYSVQYSWAEPSAKGQIVQYFVGAATGIAYSGCTPRWLVYYGVKPEGPLRDKSPFFCRGPRLAFDLS